MSKDWSYKPDIHNHQPIVEIGLGKYLFDPKKIGRKVHQINPETRSSYCKVENGTRRNLTSSNTYPDGRKACAICQHVIDDYNPKPLRNNRDAFYGTYGWAELRYSAFVKYGRTCMCCGTSRNLTVDHIKPVRKYPELMDDIDNLQILCRLCNRGKGHWDETNWREIHE